MSSKPKTSDAGQDDAAEQARGHALAAWAEEEMDIDPEGPRARFADPQDAAGRAMMEEALGGPAALTRALGGRPTLDPSGAASRQRKVRLGGPLDTRVEAAIKDGVEKDFSTLARVALVEYLDRHQIRA
jgi:hypothetical protein